MVKKRTHVNGSERITITLPTEVADRVRDKLHDPVYGKLRYGAVSQLATKLFLAWLEGKPTKDVAFTDPSAPLDMTNFLTETTSDE